MAVTATHDVLDRAGNVAATIDVHDNGETVVYVEGSTPTRYGSVGAALEAVHAVGGTIPDLED